MATKKLPDVGMVIYKPNGHIKEFNKPTKIVRNNALDGVIAMWADYKWMTEFLDDHFKYGAWCDCVAGESVIRKFEECYNTKGTVFKDADDEMLLWYVHDNLVDFLEWLNEELSFNDAFSKYMMQDRDNFYRLFDDCLTCIRQSCDKLWDD